MGIRIGGGGQQRDWSKIGFAGAESVVQALALGPMGFSNSISAFFRALEGLWGEDDVELRATNLVNDTLSYAAVAVMASGALDKPPAKKDAQKVIETVLSRAQTTMAQSEVLLEPTHLSHPAELVVFQEAADQIPHELRPFEARESEEDLTSRFRSALAEGLNRIRARRPDYFEQVVDVLSGPDASTALQTRAWERYRAALVGRFDDAPLFGEEGPEGIRLSQVYQPLRAWWQHDVDDGTNDAPSSPKSATSQNIAFIWGC